MADGPIAPLHKLNLNAATIKMTIATARSTILGQIRAKPVLLVWASANATVSGDAEPMAAALNVPLNRAHRKPRSAMAKTTIVMDKSTKIGQTRARPARLVSVLVNKPDITSVNQMAQGSNVLYLVASPAPRSATA
jgi:hypothetical protein